MSLENYDDWFGGNRFIVGGGGGGGWGGGGGGIDIPVPDISIGGGGGGGYVPDTSETLTSIVNGYEYELKVNLGNWQAGRLGAADAVSTAWQLMNGMVSACIPYGVEGSKAAAERDRRINPSMLRWDWIAYYIDPITGGNTALPPVPGGGNNTTFGFGTGNGQIMLILGLLVILYLASQE